MTRSLRRSAVLGLLFVLPLASSAEASVTIGSNLGRVPNSASTCGSGCTSLQTALPSASQATGGLASPVNGTVTSWSVRSGPGSGDPVTLRVIRPFSGGLFAGAGSSAPQTPPAGSTMSYPTSLPIAAGDRIGLDWGSLLGNHFVAAGGTEARWGPVLANGGAPSTPNITTSDTREVAVNATIEPTAAFTLDQVKSNKGSVTVVTVTVQNLGKLTAGDPSSPNVGAAAAKKKKKPKLFNNGAFRVGGPGQITLSVRASKAARKRIREKGKAIRASLKIAFVPTGGSVAAQTVRVKLKP